MSNSLKYFLTMLFVAVVLQAAHSAKAVPLQRNNSTPSHPVGTNLDVVSDWTTEIPFIDVFKLSRPWVPASARYADTGEYDALETDLAGWITSLPPKGSPETEYSSVVTYLFTKAGKNYPSGLYTVYYDGTGTIVYGGDAHKRYDLSTDGKDVVEVYAGSTSSGIIIELTETDPNGTGDYIRNIQMLLPGFTVEQAQNDIFNPDFLASIDQFSVIRFMNWMRVNYDKDWQREAQQPKVEIINPLDQLDRDPALRDSNWDEPVLWANRPLVTDARYSTEKGVPIEIVVALANRIDANVWLNVPHNVDNHYIFRLAQLMEPLLDWDKEVYFEYTNEPWNTGFGQGEYLEEQALLAGVNAASPYEARLKWYAARASALCEVWKDTWKELNEPRVNCVINAPATQPDKTELMLSCDHWSRNPCAKFIDAVAIAPYFGQHVGQLVNLPVLKQWATWGEAGLNQLQDELRYGNKLPDSGGISSAPLLTVYENISTTLSIVNDYVNDGETLELIAYEGGQHLVGIEQAAKDDPQLNQLFANFNRNWRMRKLYEEYLPKWHELGGGVFVHYKNTAPYTPWGYWGAQEYFGQPYAQKAMAIQAYIATFPEPEPPNLVHHVFMPGIVHQTDIQNAPAFFVPMPDAEREAEAANAARRPIVKEGE